MNIRRVIRANRLLAEQGHPGDTLSALEELAALRKKAEHRPQPAPSKDCGEAGHTEGRCGNAACLRGA
jgi:hypothetical protein